MSAGDRLTERDGEATPDSPQGNVFKEDTMLNIKIGDKSKDGFVNVIVSEGSEDGVEVESWKVFAGWKVTGSSVSDSIDEHGYEVIEYAGNSNFRAERN